MKLGWAACLLYIGTVFAANWAITTFGFVPVGFGLLAPAGVYFAGAAFTLRDLTQEAVGRGAVVLAILIGALLSALISPALGLASGAAFLASELADFAVYTPLRQRHWLGAVAASNVVGTVVDSALFLWLAFGSLQFLPGQVVGKGWVTLVTVLLLWEGVMLYLSGCVRPDLPPEMGVLLTPMTGYLLPPGRAWAADTGCFAAPHRHDDDRYLDWLVGRGGPERCLFATAPDVLGDAAATLARSAPMLGRIRALGFPAALVGQDGLEEEAVPWPTFDCFFVGGTTGWKESAAAIRLIGAAKARGKWVHVGRVNSLRRLRIMRRAWADSVDGTYVAYAPNLLGPRMQSWVHGVRAQLVLDI